MTDYSPYRVHPFAGDFPLIEGAEFDELVASVKDKGLYEPILLTADQSTIIDGRNRYRACIEAGRDPVFDVLEADYTELELLDLIYALNVRRRHMTTGQKDFLALKYERHYAEAVSEQERERKKGQYAAETTSADLRNSSTDRSLRSDERAAKVTGASGRGVQQAKAIERDAPDLAAEVIAGRMAIDAADRERKVRIARQPKPELVKPALVMLTLLTHTGEEVPYPKAKHPASFNETRGDGISWAAWSWNPVTGCLHGCNYCYAREIATSTRFASAYPAGFTPLFHQERLEAPEHTRVPVPHRDDLAYKRVFVCSMADLYGRWVPDSWIEQVHASMAASPQWQYITLTKFPERYETMPPPPGAWVGTSVDEQKRVKRAESVFGQLEGAAVKWLSLEPLLGPLEFTDLSVFNWVVIGAQTETQQPDGPVPALQPDWHWVLDITQQARESGCAVHWKPNLRTAPGMTWPDEYPESR